MIINRSGITIRMHVADLRVVGRATQGVKLINLRGKDTIASITKVDAEPDVEEPVEGEQPTEGPVEGPTEGTTEVEQPTEWISDKMLRC